MSNICLEKNVSDKSDNAYGFIDIFRIICSILVIFIHTKPFENNFWLDAGIGILTRVAVPFFFITSSYFFFKKIKEAKPESYNKLFLKYLFRILILYSFWFIVYQVIDVIKYANFDFLVVLKNFFFNTSGSHLWFLNACLIAISLTYFLKKILPKKVVFLISICCFLFGYFFSTLSGIFDGNHSYNSICLFLSKTIGIQNGFFFAFPYFVIGSLIVDIRKEAINQKKCLIGILLFFVILCGESLLCVLCFNTMYTFLWISAIPFSSFVFLFLISNKKQIFNANVCSFIRKMTSFVYVFHPITVIILRSIFKASGFQMVDSWNLFLTFFTIIVSYLISYIVVKISTLKYGKFLKYVF